MTGALSLVVAFFALGGCGSGRLAASPVDGASGAVPASALMGFGLGPSSRRMIGMAGGEAAGSVVSDASLDMGESPDWTASGVGTGRWTVRTRETDADGNAETEKSAGHVVGPYGTVYLSWSRSVKDTDPDGPARLFVFEPALIWFPAVMEPGVVFEDRTRMTERAVDDASKVVMTGAATRRVAIVDSDSEAWPFGEARGRAVAAELRVKVGPAEAVRRTTTIIEADGSAGDEFVDYAVRVLGVPITRQRSLLVRE